MSTIDCESEQPVAFRQVLHAGKHVFYADSALADGGAETAPGAHDYFASLAACKALTALVYAKTKGYPLERVETHVERDDSQERQGTYRLKVRLAFHGAALTDEQRQRLHDVVGRCPVHKLMTTTDVVIETAPL